MSIWIKILIGLWIYLSIGLGVVLMSQIIVSKLEGKIDDDWIWNFKLDPDYEEFGAVVIGLICFWPFIFLYLIYYLIESGLRKVFKLIWKEK